MLPDFLDALVRPAAYRRFAAESPARSARYVAFLSLILLAAFGTAVKLRLVPVVDRTFAWLETSMPVLTFSDGGVTSNLEGPTRIQHPTVKEIAVMIDTKRTDPVKVDELTKDKVIAYLTHDALYLQRGDQIETIDLSKSAPERPVTLDAATYKNMEQSFDWVVYPSLTLFFYLVFAVSLAFFGALYALAGMFYASLAGARLGFAPLFRIALHAQTAAALVRALDTVLPWPIPQSRLISLALSLAYMWLAVGACAGAPPSPEPAAPP
ncbi:MAG: DUF1189 family protein, partial [Elusimicrobia bacterium]|nr:DUF1189 family protein [Elusimicrobiota bacterium]